MPVQQQLLGAPALAEAELAEMARERRKRATPTEEPARLQEPVEFARAAELQHVLAPEAARPEPAVRYP